MNYDWVQPTLERISDILRMPDRDNSYGTPQVLPSTAWEALRFMWPVLHPCTPVPIVSPTMEGGIAFSWSGLHTEVKMVVDCLDRVWVHLSGNAPSDGPATSQQVLETALRAIERELHAACSETAKP